MQGLLGNLGRGLEAVGDGLGAREPAVRRSKVERACEGQVDDGEGEVAQHTDVPVCEVDAFDHLVALVRGRVVCAKIPRFRDEQREPGDGGVRAEATTLRANHARGRDAEDGEVRDVRREELRQGVQEVVSGGVGAVGGVAPQAVEQRVRPEGKVEHLVCGVDGELLAQHLIRRRQLPQQAQAREEHVGLDLPSAPRPLEYVLLCEPRQAEHQKSDGAGGEQAQHPLDGGRDRAQGQAAGGGAGCVEEVDDAREQEGPEDDEERVQGRGEEGEARDHDVGEDEQHQVLPVEHVGGCERRMRPVGGEKEKARGR